MIWLRDWKGWYRPWDVQANKIAIQCESSLLYALEWLMLICMWYSVVQDSSDEISLLREQIQSQAAEFAEREEALGREIEALSEEIMRYVLII
jgi:hypothetical protein